MKRITMSFLLIMLFPLCAFAGEIYGSLEVNGRSIGPGVKVEIRCGNNTYTEQTDGYGSYSVYVRDTGGCHLTVQYGSQSPQIDVYSYPNSVRYDLVLEGSGGQYSLRRK